VNKTVFAILSEWTADPSVTRSRALRRFFKWEIRRAPWAANHQPICRLPIDASWDPDFWGPRFAILRKPFALRRSPTRPIWKPASDNARCELPRIISIRASDAQEKLLNECSYSLPGIVFDDPGPDDTRKSLPTRTGGRRRFSEQPHWRQATDVCIQRAQFEHALAVLRRQDNRPNFRFPNAPLKDKPVAVPLDAFALLERRPILPQRNGAYGSKRAQSAWRAPLIFPFPSVTLTRLPDTRARPR